MPNTFKLYHLGLYFKICLVNYLSQFAACQNPKCTNAACHTLTAIHTLTTPEYTHDHFSHAIKKNQHMLFIANSFQNLQNKKRGIAPPRKKTLFYFFHIFSFCHVHVFLPDISLVTISNRCHVINF